MPLRQTRRPSALVLGAGIQGICAALALEQEGHAVTLIDAASTCMTRASLHNEGKIHLGFVYAKDDTLRTAGLMLRSAMRFGPLVEKFLGRRIHWEDLRARSFDYLILNDSMRNPEQILAVCHQLEDLYREERKDRGLHYLGRRPERLFESKSVSEYRGQVNPDRVAAALSTEEAPLRVRALREHLTHGLRSRKEIETLFGHRVESIERTSSGFRVEGTNRAGETWRHESEIVVNCLWEGRLGLDEQLDLLPPRRWVYRLKYRLFAELPDQLRQLPSLTMVLGPYGDIVTEDDGPAYLSWYPASMRGWSSEVTPPRDWNDACEGHGTGKPDDELARAIVEGFKGIVPGIDAARAIDLAAGVIFSWGESDIDDPESELHRRDEIGVGSHDGYFSINTGKFTCAPMFAEELTRIVRGSPACL